eukprot:5337996-Pyramimonas_sp.AAC.1
MSSVLPPAPHPQHPSCLTSTSYRRIHRAPHLPPRPPTSSTGARKAFCIQRRQHFGNTAGTDSGSSALHSVPSCRREGERPATRASSIHAMVCNAGHTEHHPLHPHKHLSDPNNTPAT